MVLGMDSTHANLEAARSHHEPVFVVRFARENGAGHHEAGTLQMEGAVHGQAEPARGGSRGDGAGHAFQELSQFRHARSSW